MAMGKGYRVFHKIPPDRETPYSILMDSKAMDESLMFESGAVVVLTVEEVEPLRKQYIKLVDAYGCLGALCITLGNEKIQFIVMVTSCLSVGKIGESEVFRITGVQFISLRNDPNDEERVAEIRKLLSSGTFYFTWKVGGNPWDLSLCAQRKLQDHDSDNRFFWNRMLHVHFQRYGIDCSKWLLKAMCGGIEIRTIYAGHRQAKACLISRLSCERAGTRFNVRGANDDGNVANFVETEQVIFLEEQIASFVQTRGSVPLFWEQPGIQVGSHKVHMSRGYEMAAPAFDRHLRTIRQQYGDQVIINLLGSREGEQMLSQAFMNHHAASSHKQDIAYYHFDYHAEIKGTNLKNLEKLKTRILRHLHHFDFFFTDGETISHQQTGTIRTNCLDCLDRTNATQTMMGMEMLQKQLDALGLSSKPQMIGRFEEVYKQIWVHNGDHISRIYTGTGALGGGRSKYSDASRSATRTIQNNFLDGSKQEAIDILLMGSSLHGSLADRTRALLGSRYLHASENILRSMTSRFKEYTKTETYRICVGTYNVNGGKHYRSIAYKHQSLADWLLDAHKTHPNILVDDVDYDKPVDIFAVGFEEIVDLNASNIMSASTTNAREWQKEVIKTISRDHKYVILTSIQLVGVVLYVFVRPHLAPFIRDVAVEKVKTGLGGATGNKGGVAIRFLLNSTSICFVCAHLAAGQNQVNDRNADYTEITRKMSFPMSMDSPRKGRTILSHDCVFWCGDFNYRIDLTNEEVKSLVASENWGALQDMDQLNAQRAQNNAFQGFSEGRTNFPPTYKYDTFSDDYDTSEKCRTPAWTDRILWKVKTVKDAEDSETSLAKVKMLLYTRAELRTSDHRPVVALFDVDTVVVDEDKKVATLSKVVGEQGPPDGTVIVSTTTGEELSDETVNAVVEQFNEVGDMVIVRFVGLDMWVLYQHGRFALEALQFDQQEFAGTTVRVRLKTKEWRGEIEKELNLCSSNTGALYNQFSNSLLGDDFSVPSMEFDMGEDMGDDAEDEEVANVLQAPLAPQPSSGTNTPTGQRSPAPSPKDIPGGPPVNPPRPARPPTQPAQKSPLSATGSGWDSVQVVRENVARVGTSPSPEPQSRQPPARPSAPPTKPPPPQRPPGGPPRPSTTPAQDTTNQGSGPGGPGKRPPPKTRQPLRPPPSAASLSRKSSSKIGQIGLPTNVTHHGHATSIEEAQELIHKLLSTGTESADAGMAAPLVPSKSETNLSAGSGQLAPKTVPRSKTSQDIGEAAATTAPHPAPPQPAPRRQSSDNLYRNGDSAGADSPIRSVNNDSAQIAVSRPRPAPRKDVQSCVIDSDSSSLSEMGGPHTSPSKRPGSVMVLPPPPSAGTGGVSRTAPPPPATRPAPAPPGPKPGTNPSAAPVPPARPSRPSDKTSNNVSGLCSQFKSSDPFDTSNVNAFHPPQPDSHILDRENSMIEDSAADPFDTTFAQPKATNLFSQSQSSNRDPFDTSNVSHVNNSQPTGFSQSEPFDTQFVSQPQPNISQGFSDPFDTSNVFRGRNDLLPQSSSANPVSSSCDNEQLAQPEALSSLRNGDSPQIAPRFEPDISPPPLPPDMDAPKFTVPAPTCPEEAPPPPPRVVPPVSDVTAVVPPPVPSRPGGAPPPVPKRPST